jgi:Rad3-related DNA helicase
MKKAGRKRNFCPFYFGRRNKHTADLLLMPYNYILDPRIASLYHVDLHDAIIIFDEAHNVCGIAEEGESLRISVETLQSAILQLDAFAADIEKSNSGVKRKVKVKGDPEISEINTNLSEISSFRLPISNLLKFMM